MTQLILWETEIEPVDEIRIIKRKIKKKAQASERGVPCLYCGAPSMDGLCDDCWEGGHNEHNG